MDQQPYNENEEIDLRDIFRVLWAGKWLIASVTFSATVIALIVVFILPNIYQAEALLAPNDDEGSSGLSALASKFGGIASLAGISLENDSTDKTAVGLEILHSRKFISEFIERHNILVPLMAVKGWDSKTGQLKIDPDIYNVTEEKWVRNVWFPRKAIPSWQEAYKYFIEDILLIVQNEKTGFITIAIQHYSPVAAKQWVDWLIQDINATIMQQDVEEAEQAIKYLNEQIATTLVADLQTVFFSLIEEQMKTVVLAKASKEYLLKTLDPAVVPEKEVKPKRVMIVTFSLIVSGVLSVFLVLAMGLRQVRQ